MENINPEILGQLIGAPGGVYAKDLAEADENYKDQIRGLLSLGLEIDGVEDPGGNAFYILRNPEKAKEVIEEMGKPVESKEPSPTLPIPPQVSSSPAETPPSDAVEHDFSGAEKVDLETPGFDSDAMFHVSDFKIRTREGQMPAIIMTPILKIDAQAALQFSMDLPAKAKIIVYTKIAQEETEEAKKKGDKVVQPKDYGTVQIQNKPTKEVDPKKKSKSQVSKEIDEQVQKGELSPELADATAKMRGL